MGTIILVTKYWVHVLMNFHFKDATWTSQMHHPEGSTLIGIKCGNCGREFEKNG